MSDDLKLGDRVVIKHSGEVGHIEAIDGEFCDVRALTPKNVPSCVITMCRTDTLVIVGEHVVPQPRSKEWHRESREFYEFVKALIMSKECRKGE